MFNGIEKINEAIEYIERNLCGEITCKELAEITALSEYEFRRIFSFVVGVPVGEYIRRRKLSLAADELMLGKDSVTQIAVKYGYDTSSSFTRAFKEQYGRLPTSVKGSNDKICTFVRPRFELKTRGGGELSYTLKKLDGFYISGVSGESEITDTCCCESVWALYEQTFPQSNQTLYAAYLNGEKNVVCYVGERAERAKNESLFVSEGLWACFDVPAVAAENEVNDLYETILYSWLPSGFYQRDEARPNLEKFGQNGDFTVMIPVKEKDE